MDNLDLTEIKNLNGQKISCEKWEAIRHHEEIKRISMLDVLEIGTKYGIIFKDLSSIFIYI